MPIIILPLQHEKLLQSIIPGVICQSIKMPILSFIESKLIWFRIENNQNNILSVKQVKSYMLSYIPQSITSNEIRFYYFLNIDKITVHLRRHIRQIESVTMLFTDILLNRKNGFVTFNIQIFSVLTYINGIMHLKNRKLHLFKLNME